MLATCAAASNGKAIWKHCGLTSGLRRLQSLHDYLQRNLTRQTDRVGTAVEARHQDGLLACTAIWLSTTRVTDKHWYQNYCERVRTETMGALTVHETRLCIRAFENPCIFTSCVVPMIAR